MRKVEIGETYNYLTVLSEAGIHGSGRHFCMHYNCQCVCGKFTRVSKYRLGRTKSCGCVSESKARPVEDPVGNRFGRLVVTHRQDTGRRLCECICDCGGTTLVELRNLKAGESQSCGCLRLERLTTAQKERFKKYRASLGLDPETLIKKRETGGRLSRKIFERDSFTCVLCNDKGCQLNAHHILPFRGNEELVYEETNLVTLCRECHFEVHNFSFVSGGINKELTDVLVTYIKNQYLNK